MTGFYQPISDQIERQWMFPAECGRALRLDLLDDFTGLLFRFLLASVLSDQDALDLPVVLSFIPRPNLGAVRNGLGDLFGPVGRTDLPERVGIAKPDVDVFVFGFDRLNVGYFGHVNCTVYCG